MLHNDPRFYEARQRLAAATDALLHASTPDEEENTEAAWQKAWREYLCAERVSWGHPN